MAPQSNHSLAICWTKTAQRAPWQPPYQIQLLSPSFLLVLIFQGDPCLRGCLHWHESEMCDCVWWTESHLLFMVFCLTSTQGRSLARDTSPGIHQHQCLQNCSCTCCCSWGSICTRCRHTAHQDGRPHCMPPRQEQRSSPLIRNIKMYSLQLFVCLL